MRHYGNSTSAYKLHFVKLSMLLLNIARETEDFQGKAIMTKVCPPVRKT